MPNARVPLPARMDLESLFKFGKELDYYSQHDRLVIEIPEKVFFSPFAMLFLSLKIRRFRIQCPDLVIIFDGWERHSYLSHMGFFDMCGFNHGRQVGEAWGSHNYLPITETHRSSFFETEIDEYEEFQDLVQRRAEKLATILSRNQTENRNLYDILSYCLREIIRNVFEHGETESVYYAAQYWPDSNKVEVAIADYGVGVRKGLGGNPNFRFSTDKEALEYALLPGVSGKTHLPRMSANWFNSGYGLYMTNRLARNGGNFVIVSGENAIHFSRRTKHNYVTSFPGTAIRLNLDVSEIGAVQARLDEFRQDGSRLAATIKGSGNRPPSAMSLLLRRDYQR